MPKVQRIGENDIYVVYGTRKNKEGDTEFFLYDGFWFWEDSENFKPANE